MASNDQPAATSVDSSPGSPNEPGASVAASSAASPSPRPWLDHMTNQRPRLDRCRDPWHWLIDALPWFLRRFYLSAQYREWVPNGARHIGTRRPPWEAFDLGRRLHSGCRCVWDASPHCPIHGEPGRG